MLKLTRQNFNLIRDRLLRKQKEVETDLKDLEKKDPVMLDGLAESTEPGTESWMADVHNQVVAVKHSLQQMLLTIKKSLANLKLGRYGKCERCGKSIEQARLEVIPEATLCLSCSKTKK